MVVHFRDTGAHDVRIAGDFNGWVPDKGVRSLIEAQDAKGTFTVTLDGDALREYRARFPAWQDADAFALLDEQE